MRGRGSLRWAILIQHCRIAGISFYGARWATNPKFSKPYCKVATSLITFYHGNGKTRKGPQRLKTSEDITQWFGRPPTEQFRYYNGILMFYKSVERLLKVLFSIWMDVLFLRGHAQMMSAKRGEGVTQILTKGRKGGCVDLVPTRGGGGGGQKSRKFSWRHLWITP